MVVARPSRWGNPFRVGVDGDGAVCVARFRQALIDGELSFGLDDARQALAGRDLACWCPPGDACHADVLLEVANNPPTDNAEGAAASRRPSGHRRGEGLGHDHPL